MRGLGTWGVRQIKNQQSKDEYDHELNGRNR